MSDEQMIDLALAVESRPACWDKMHPKYLE